MKLDARGIRSLETILQEEISLYVEYVGILTQEQACVVTLRAGDVSDLSHRRSQIISKLEILKEKRNSIVEQTSGREAMRLTEFVEQACSPVDKKRVLPLVQKIKDLLKLVEDKSKEFSQVLNYSLGLVNGEISLLWSASQSVTRVYNAFGSVQEGVQPSAPRTGSLLGEA
jgi:hypothetical protein